MTTQSWLLLVAAAYGAGVATAAAAIRWLAIRADVRQAQRRLDDL